MSTLRAPAPRPRTSRPTLRPVQTTRRRRQMPFIMVFVSLLGIGMIGLLVLTTRLQDQAFEMRTLQQEATELTYRQASLEADADKARSPQALAALASELGMRPNTHAVYIDLPSGKIIGTPTPVKATDASSIVVKTPEQVAAEAAARAEAAQKKQAQSQQQQTTQR